MELFNLGFSIFTVTINRRDVSFIAVITLLMPINKAAERPLIHPDPTPEEIERGKRFAAWLQGAIFSKGWNMKRLADVSGVTPTNIGIYIANGVDPQTGKIRRPRPETIKKLVTALEADISAAMLAAGYTTDTDEDRVIIAPGRAVRVLAWEGDEETFIDMVLTRDAIDLILAHNHIRETRSNRRN